ncbi:expressed unknown protein [Seminavis robusta]|uniref:EGF-like domain-containing protein n=1 Tax=Seminavis robusta TaxID=568900 RepID=A0A9N8E8C3_9STRA|nr:expressed unknown protein [Seminavis robusta]|eukprot:Sro766_g199280.1 n/a (1349) ;mRNA; f:3010-7332
MNFPRKQEVGTVNTDGLFCFDDDEYVDSGNPKEMARRAILSSTSAGHSLLDTLTPKDIEKLAQLLKPAIIRPDEDGEMFVEAGDLVKESALPRQDWETCGNEDERSRTEWHAPFGQSTYSLIYLCSIDSPAFWYAAFVYFLQITTILLTMIDVIDWDGLNLPPMVDLSVTIAQGVTLFQAIAFQSDLIEVVMKFKDGFHPEALEKHPGASYATWLVSCIAQLIAGLLLLVTIFILILQVDSVLDIMLNFAALEFMADIDDVAFSLAKSGFLGGSIQRAATGVTNFKVRKRPSSDQGFRQRSWKSGVFLLIIVVLVSAWATIVAFRSSGQYLCSTIMVNMGDDFVPSLGTFNGLYDLDPSALSGLEWRAEYVERRSIEIDTPGRGIFGYCSDIKAWTFRVESSGSNEKGDPCNWISRSAETDTFDISETATIQWFVRDDTLREVVLEPFILFCFDCSNAEEGSGDCGGKGICTNAVCDCEDGWYGLRCEFVSPCTGITVDARTEKFASTRDWVSEYQSIELTSGALVEAYHRPVYIHEYSTGDYDVVLFTGGRWALTSSKLLPHGGRIPTSDLSDGQDDAGNDIGNFFKHSFHGYNGYQANYSVAFLSDYMQIGTQMDSSSPVGFSWHHATAKERTADSENQGMGKLVDTEFLCRTCDDDLNPCLYDGRCNDGHCECYLDSFGSLCEVPPVGNGHCDPFFNAPEFKMDGGDCCESTCESTPRYACGAEEHGYVSTGYYYCKEPKDEWDNYVLNSDVGTWSGYALDLSMKSLAVSELLEDRVLIYDKFESSWILRETITGTTKSNFGLHVALSAGPFNAVTNPSFKAPLIVVIADSNSLQIYRCNSDGCTPTQKFPKVQSFALSDDGTVLAMAFLQRHQPPNFIQVYESDQGLFQFRSNVTVTRNNTKTFLYSMSLSGDGSQLAVQAKLQGADPKTKARVVTDEHIAVMRWSENSQVYELETDFPLNYVVSSLSYQLSLAWNQDGTVLAYLFPKCQGSQLHIYVRDQDTWVQRRAPETNTTDCIDSSRPGRNNALALSGDGSMIAFRVGNKVRVYRWEAEFKFWNSLGDEFPFIHYPIAMSVDGSELAIGSPEEDIGGVTAIYSLPGRKECPSGMTLLRLSLTLEPFNADKVSWSIMNNSTGEVLFEQGPYPPDYGKATIVEETCVPADSCYIFSIYNREGKGIRVPGQYVLFLDGEKVGQGTFEGLFGTINFGNCATCPVGTKLFRMAMLSCVPVHWKLWGAFDEVATSKEKILYHPPFNDDIFEIDPSCNDGGWSEDCTDWAYYESCLDPTECFAVQSDSNVQAYLEVDDFGAVRKLPSPSSVCTRVGTVFGNQDVCHNRVWRELHSV